MRKIFLDTDMGPDCDDVAALVILHALRLRGECEIIGVTHCVAPPWGARCIDAINNYYSAGNIPIGETKDTKFLSGDGFQKYNKVIGMPYAHRQYDEAVSLMRRTLAAHTNVCLVAIGPLKNIRDLLKSEADEVSPLNGIDLVKNSVGKIVIMGGAFSEELLVERFAEWNFEVDISAAQYVIDNSPVPIVLSGFEIGKDVLTGDNLDDLPEDNVLKIAYKLYNNEGFRPSWDLTAVYYAVRGLDSCWDLQDNITVKVDDKGVCSFTNGGIHAFLKKKKPDVEVKNILNDLLIIEPGKNINFKAEKI